MMHAHRRPLPMASSRGSALIFALIALVSMSLAALALVRSVDTGTVILGNVGFKREATAAADEATRQAIDWLQTADVSANNAAQGYYATTATTLDATGFQQAANTRTLIDWDSDNCGYADSGTYAGCGQRPRSVSVSGVTAHYVILRLCADLAATQCSRPLNAVASADGSKGSLDYANPGGPEVNTAVYYRIVVRVQGARQSQSFTETIVQR